MGIPSLEAPEAHLQNAGLRGGRLRPTRGTPQTLQCALSPLEDLRKSTRGGPKKAPSGTGHIDKNGYRVRRSNGSPVFEHRLVMEALLERPLFPDENVHHRNGDRSDNGPENRELWSTSQPRGQRVEDKVEWAVAILVRYQSELLAPEAVAGRVSKKWAVGDLNARPLPCQGKRGYRLTFT